MFLRILKFKKFIESKENLYKEITPNELINKLDNMVFVDFDEKEIKVICDLFLKKNKNYVFNYLRTNFKKIFGFLFKVPGRKIEVFIRKKLPVLNCFTMYKNDDEWYYLVDEMLKKVYLCDSFNGLIECINDIV